MKPKLLLAALFAALALPSGALAASCAPPGNSGVDQYFETVPGAGCNQGSAGGGGHGRGGHLPPGTSHQLAAQGAAGRAVQRLVASTGGSGSTGASGSTGTQVSGSGGGQAGTSNGSGTGSRHAVSGAHVTVPPAPGRSLLSALLHPIVTGSASGGTGVLLPIFLAGVLVLVLAGLVLRRSRVSS